MKKIIVLTLISLMLAIVAGCAGGASIAKLTPIPTLIPATLPAPRGEVVMASFGRGDCPILALDLFAAWVKAGHPESDPFEIQSLTGVTCQASFPVDVLPLFKEPNVWFSGSIACVSCHGDTVKTASAQLGLATYADIVAGSRRADPNAKGKSILDDGSGNFEKAQLYTRIFSRQMPIGRPQDSPQKGPVVFVGKKK
jgi:hypothetical protein